MRITHTTFDKIAASYNVTKDWTGKSELDKALAEVIRRHGGLFVALTEDARRDLILTLGDNRRAHHAYSVRQRMRSIAAE